MIWNTPEEEKRLAMNNLQTDPELLVEYYSPSTSQKTSAPPQQLLSKSCNSCRSAHASREWFTDFFFKMFNSGGFSSILLPEPIARAW